MAVVLFNNAGVLTDYAGSFVVESPMTQSDPWNSVKLHGPPARKERLPKREAADKPRRRTFP